MIRIWGRSSSSNVMKVLWLLDELGLDFERIDVGGPFGGTHTPEYLAMNPAGLVPTLEEDAFSLFESNAILRYLGSEYASDSNWYPATSQLRAHTDAWLDLQQTLLTGPLNRVFIGLVRTPSEKRDPAAIAAAALETGRVWTIVEAGLAGCDFLGGAQPSIADVAFGPSLHRWFMLPIDRPELPMLRAWYDRLLTRPAYAKHCAQPLSP
jgi:glutathione S-transferase